MEWDRIDYIEDSFNSLEKNLNSHYSYLEDNDISDRIKDNFIKSKTSFINAVKENFIDEELSKANNWCEYISKFMKNLAAFTEGELAGYENRKLTKEEIEDRINNIVVPDSNEIGGIKSIKRFFENSHDTVKYTILFDHEEYTQKFLEVQRLLKAKRMLETLKVRNTWLNNSGYKSIDTVVKCFKDNKEYLFEIRFHTLKSYNADIEGKRYYDIVRDSDNYSVEERRKADDKQYEIYESVETPPGVLEIQSYGV